MANNVDIVVLRQRRKRRRFLIRFIVFLVLVALCVLIYMMRDSWFPQLEGIGSRYQNVTQNDNVEMEGDFSLNIYGGVDYHADFVSNQLFLLCDKYLYIYGTDGKLRDSRQHAYSNAVMKVSGSRALLYSSNGQNFRVDTPSKMLYEIETEQPIWFCEMNEKGYAAVVTESDTYACRLCIYDTTGKLIYTRDCVERLADVSFCGNGCVCSTIGAVNGDLVTVQQYIPFDGADVLWTTSELDTLVLSLHTLSDDGVFVIGDTKTAYYSSTGALVNAYDFKGTLVDFAFKDDRAAVLLKNEERRQSTLLLYSDRSTPPVALEFDSICKYVIMDDQTAYLLGNGRIEGYSFTGEKVFTLEVDDSYDSILKNGKYFYLLGYDRINRTGMN
ncbi:MAG: hypothetical protein IJ055_07115 [Oscillospiraceae bacterium]|nr:hypothetical protein [Oscillospiraceae bacterium]